jgi:hypothetical protein
VGQRWSGLWNSNKHKHEQTPELVNSMNYRDGMFMAAEGDMNVEDKPQEQPPGEEHALDKFEFNKKMSDMVLEVLAAAGLVELSETPCALSTRNDFAVVRTPVTTHDAEWIYRYSSSPETGMVTHKRKRNFRHTRNHTHVSSQYKNSFTVSVDVDGTQVYKSTMVIPPPLKRAKACGDFSKLA